jgi:hypothetical protein
VRTAVVSLKQASREQIDEKPGVALHFVGISKMLTDSVHYTRMQMLVGPFIFLAFLVSTDSVMSAVKPFQIPSAPPGWGMPVIIGGSAYINFSMGCCEDLVKFVDELPRCMHEGATEKERNGWRLSVRDAKHKRREERKSRLRSKGGSESKKVEMKNGGRMGFVAPMPLLGFRPTAPWCSTPRTLLAPSLFSKSGVEHSARPSTLFRVGLTQLSASGLSPGNDKGQGGAKGFGKQGNSDRGISGLKKQKMERPDLFKEVEMHFTCNKCETRQKKRFTRNAYEKGVVIVV